MEEHQSQAVPGSEEDTAMLAKAQGNTQVGGLSKTAQPQGPLLEPHSEALLTNANRPVALQKSVTRSSFAKEQGNDAEVAAAIENAVRQRSGPVSYEHGMAQASQPSFIDMVGPYSTTASSKQPCSEGSFRLDTDVTGATVPTQDFNEHIYPKQSQQLQEPLVITEEQSRAKFAGAAVPANAGGVSSILEIIAGRLPEHQEAEDNARKLAINTPRCTRNELLQHLVGFVMRRMRLGHRSKAQRRIRVLPGLQVLRNDSCCLKLLLADELANVAATFTTEYAEQLAQWKYLLTSLMTVHGCIHTLCLNISAVAPLSGRFYRAFRLRGGTAEIDIGSTLDFTEGIRHLSVFPATDTRFGSSCYEPNSNLAWILDAIRDMPYLHHLKIYMVNAVSERCSLDELSLIQTRFGSTELRRQIYDVDAPYAPMLFCAGGDKSAVSTAIATDRIIIPRLLASRELTGSAALLTPYPVTVTCYPLTDDRNFIASLIIRRRGDQ